MNDGMWCDCWCVGLSWRRFRETKLEQVGRMMHHVGHIYSSYYPLMKCDIYVCGWLIDWCVRRDGSQGHRGCAESGNTVRKGNSRAATYMLLTDSLSPSYSINMEYCVCLLCVVMFSCPHSVPCLFGIDRCHWSSTAGGGDPGSGRRAAGAAAATQDPRGRAPRGKVPVKGEGCDSKG